MRCLGGLLGLAALHPISAAPTDDVGLFQSSLRMSADALHVADTMSAQANLDLLDHSALASRFLGFLQGTRFHRSFQLVNNISQVVSDLESHTKKQIFNVTKGLKKAKDQKKVVELVVGFFADERQALDRFMSKTEEKLAGYMADVPLQDRSWITSLTGPVMRNMKQMLAPLSYKVASMQGLDDAAAVCLQLQDIYSELAKIDEVIKERDIPEFNKTSSLIPVMSATATKGRVKMLRRFADQGYSVLEKARNIATTPNRTLSALFAKHLKCGGDWASEGSSTPPTTNLEKVNQRTWAGEAKPTAAPRVQEKKEVVDEWWKDEEPAAEEVKPEAPKAEEVKQEAPKIEEKKPEAPKAEEAKQEAPKVEEKKPEAPKAEEAKQEAPKVEEKKPESPKVEEKTEVEKVEEKRPEALKIEEVKPEAPKVEEKKPDAPKVEQVKPEAPKIEEVKPEAPKVEQVKPEAPKVEQVKPEAPKIEEVKPEPKVEQVKPEAPKAEEIKPEAPKVEEPVKTEPQASSQAEAQEAKAQPAAQPAVQQEAEASSKQEAKASSGASEQVEDRSSAPGLVAPGALAVLAIHALLRM